MSDVSTNHPDLTSTVKADWKFIRASMSGESSVKALGEAALPMPGGFRYDASGTAKPDNGAAQYDSYKKRARFPELLSPAVSSMVGIIHDSKIDIKLPEGLEYIREKATKDGLTLDDLHRKITRNLLTIGRYGLLADAGGEGSDVWIAGFAGEKIINWDHEFFVIDDSGMVRKGFVWENVAKFRVLKIVDGAYSHVEHVGGNEVDKTVSAVGNQRITRIPFCVANARDVVPDLEASPLIGIANAARAIYQLSADYRHQLFWSGQETLVAINGEAPGSVGAGVAHQMDGDDSKTPDLKYVGPSCIGIAAHKIAIDDEIEAAAAAGSRMFQGSSSGQESGDARRMRMKAEAASIVTVAQSSCSLLERSLRDAAMMQGLNESEVNVTPPKDLMDRTLTPTEAKAMWETAEAGGVSWETYYENLQRGGIASPDRDAEQEFSLIEERELGLGP